MDQARAIIKKYENRRLYDTSNSRYVNLYDIAQMVRDGIDVQVVDANTGEDLTRIVLTQIIVENAKTPDSGFPVDILRQMVIASGRVGRDSLLNYMRAIIDLYQNTYRAFTPGFNPFLHRKGDLPSHEPPLPGTAPASEQDLHQSSVQELLRRIEELERLVAERIDSEQNSKPKKSSGPSRSARAKEPPG